MIPHVWDHLGWLYGLTSIRASALHWWGPEGRNSTVCSYMLYLYIYMLSSLVCLVRVLWHGLDDTIIVGSFGVSYCLHLSIRTALMRPRIQKQYCLQLYIYILAFYQQINEGVSFQRNYGAASVEFVKRWFEFSSELIIRISHRKEFLQLTLRVLALYNLLDMPPKFCIISFGPYPVCFYLYSSLGENWREVHFI